MNTQAYITESFALEESPEWKADGTKLAIEHPASRFLAMVEQLQERVNAAEEKANAVMAELEQARADIEGMRQAPEPTPAEPPTDERPLPAHRDGVAGTFDDPPPSVGPVADEDKQQPAAEPPQAGKGKRGK